MPRQDPSSQNRHSALALYVAHRNFSAIDRGSVDETQQIVQAIETDDVVDALDLGNVVGIHLRVATGNQHFCRRIQSLRAPHQLARLPVGAIGHRASVDHVAVGLLLERHERMLLGQSALNHRRIVLIDFATERGDGDLHVFISQNICRLPTPNGPALHIGNSSSWASR